MRNFVALLGLMAFGISGWLLVRGWEDSPPEIVPTSETSRALDAQTTRVAADAESDGQAQPRRELEADPETDRIDLFTVRAPDESPIGGVTVYYAALGQDGLTDPEWTAFHRDELGYARAHLPSIQTDALGHTSLPRTESGWLLVATKGDLYATGAWAALDAQMLEYGLVNDRSVTLHLCADHTVHMHVVDASGRPVTGARIAFERSDSPGSEPVPEEIGSSDDTGSLLVRHFQDLVRSEATSRAWIYAEGPGLQSNRVEVDPLDPPNELELRFPPSGSVTVQLVDADGERLDLTSEYPHGLVELRRGTVRDGAAFFLGPSFTARFDDTATARFSDVALDEDWTLKTTGVRELVEFEGPLHAGADVAVEMRRPANGVWIAGRLIDQTGAPVSHLDFALQFDKEGQWSPNVWSSESGTDGRFREWADPALVDTTLDPRVKAPWPARNPRSDWGATLPQPIVVGHTLDLGDLVVTPASRIVAGTVRKGGEPFHGELFAAVECLVGAEWRQEIVTKLNSDPDGRFELPGIDRSPLPMRLSLHDLQHPPGPAVTFSPGAAALEIDLTR